MNMLAQGKQIWTYLKQTLNEFSDDDGPSMAAAIAYYTTFSLPPLLVLIVWVAGLFIDPSDVQGRLLEQVGGLVGSDGAEQVEGMIHAARQTAEGGGVGAVIGIIALLFGATGAFVELQNALNTAWGVKPDPEQGGVRGFLMKRLASLGMVVGISFLLLVSLVISALISFLGDWLGTVVPGLSAPLLFLFDILLSLFLFSLLIGIMFRTLPDAELSWKDVQAGALLTAVLFILGKFAIGFYLGRSNVGSVFGAAGSLAIILTWIYYSSMILLIGAEFTQVWAQGHHRRIMPERGALKVTETRVTLENRNGDEKEERTQKHPKKGEPTGTKRKRTTHH